MVSGDFLKKSGVSQKFKWPIESQMAIWIFVLSQHQKRMRLNILFKPKIFFCQRESSNQVGQRREAGGSMHSAQFTSITINPQAQNKSQIDTKDGPTVSPFAGCLSTNLVILNSYICKQHGFVCVFFVRVATFAAILQIDLRCN